jgi:hypothetical protein
LEKRLMRVQRWVDRCMEACRCNAWNSAIAELECARAELDSASREIWEAASETQNRMQPRWLYGSKAVLLHVVPVAILILFLAVGPTSMESFFSPTPLAIETSPSVEWVTADEKVLLENLRKNLSRNLAADFPEAGVERVAVGRPAARSKPLNKVESTGQGKAQIPAVFSQPGVSVAAEDLLSLIQVGQRALRPDGEGLRVERP